MPPVLHFLIVFDRKHGRLLSEREFVDAGAALEARFRTERMHRDNPDIEVVVLTAQDKHAVRLTHARYFQSLSELASASRRPTAGTAAAG